MVLAHAQLFNLMQNIELLGYCPSFFIIWHILLKWTLLIVGCPAQHTTLPPLQAHGGASTATLLAAMTQSDLWGLAQMDSVVNYLLGNRHLELPTNLREILVQGL